MRPELHRFFRLQLPIIAVSAAAALVIWYAYGADTLKDVAVYIVVVAVFADVALGRFVKAK